MANGITYGIAFPFVDSFTGRYLDVTNSTEGEIRANLVHLLLTRKGSRYFLPDFGTGLLEYIFEPLDGPTFKNIESEIRDSVQKYMPQLQLTNINISAPTGEAAGLTATSTGGVTDPQIQMTNQNVTEYTATVRIDYAISNDVFNTKDFVILNI
jgi:phage baseplate assembly protein W